MIIRESAEASRTCAPASKHANARSIICDPGRPSGSRMTSPTSRSSTICATWSRSSVSYVELGTDSWISKITGSIMASPQKGLMLFVYTSSLMFALRFVAGPIVHRISPLGLLLVSGVLGAIGLTLLGNAVGVLMCVIAATVYAALGVNPKQVVYDILDRPRPILEHGQPIAEVL